jgi:hypothetical protein
LEISDGGELDSTQFITPATNVDRSEPNESARWLGKQLGVGDDQSVAPPAAVAKSERSDTSVGAVQREWLEQQMSFSDGEFEPPALAGEGYKSATARVKTPEGAS